MCDTRDLLSFSEPGGVGRKKYWVVVCWGESVPRLILWVVVSYTFSRLVFFSFFLGFLVFFSLFFFNYDENEENVL